MLLLRSASQHTVAHNPPERLFLFLQLPKPKDACEKRGENTSPKHGDRYPIVVVESKQVYKILDELNRLIKSYSIGKDNLGESDSISVGLEPELKFCFLIVEVENSTCGNSLRNGEGEPSKIEAIIIDLN